MPRVSLYEGGQVERQGTAGTRLQPVDRGAPALATGLRSLGAGLGEMAQAHQAIVELRAEEEAKRLDVEHMRETATFRRQVRDARGAAALPALQSAEDNLKKYNAKLIASASSPLARRMLERSIATRTTEEVSSWGDFAFDQERQAGDAATANRAAGFRETALDHPADSPESTTNLFAGLNEIRTLGQRQGWDEATVQQKSLEYNSGYHTSRVNQLFQADDVRGAQSYIDTHREEMTAEDEQQSRALLHGELIANQKASDAAFIMEGGQAPAAAEPRAKEDPAPPPGEGRWHSPLRTRSVTVPGGQYGAPRSYGGHAGRDYAAPAGTPVYPMAEGVAHVTRSRGGGNTVEIQYAGGYKSRYLHLQDGSIGIRDGQRVGPDDIVGRIGNTGTASHGNHLHAELITPQGRVDPSKMTDRPAPALPAADGRRIDLADAYRRIEAQPWSESRKRRAREGVQEWASQNDQVRARTEQDADRAITQALVGISKGGGKLTSLTQLPADALRSASPSTLLQLQETITANNKPEPPKANSSLMNELIVMAATDPNSFLRQVNPEMLRGRVTDEEVQSLVRMKTEIATREGPQPSQVLGVIRWVLPETGLLPQVDPNKTGAARTRLNQERSARQHDIEGRLLGAVQARLRQTKGKEKITQQDILDAVRAETTMVRSSDRTQTAPLFMARDSWGVWRVPIPEKAKPLIEEALRRAGLPNTETNRAQLYLNNRSALDAAR